MHGDMYQSVQNGSDQSEYIPSKEQSSVEVARVPDWPQDGTLLLEDAQTMLWKVLFGIFDVAMTLTPVLFVGKLP